MRTTTDLPTPIHVTRGAVVDLALAAAAVAGATWTVTELVTDGSSAGIQRSEPDVGDVMANAFTREELLAGYTAMVAATTGLAGGGTTGAGADTPTPPVVPPIVWPPPLEQSPYSYDQLVDWAIAFVDDATGNP